LAEQIVIFLEHRLVAVGDAVLAKIAGTELRGGDLERTGARVQARRQAESENEGRDGGRLRTFPLRGRVALPGRRAIARGVARASQQAGRVSRGRLFASC